MTLKKLGFYGVMVAGLWGFAESSCNGPGTKALTASKIDPVDAKAAVAGNNTKAALTSTADTLFKGNNVDKALGVVVLIIRPFAQGFAYLGGKAEGKLEKELDKSSRPKSSSSITLPNQHSTLG